MPVENPDRQVRYHLTGWVLFLVCSLLFLYVAVRDKDVVLGLASLVFLGGCAAFLIPLLFPSLVTDMDGGDEGDGSPEETG